MRSIVVAVIVAAALTTAGCSLPAPTARTAATATPTATHSAPPATPTPTPTPVAPKPTPTPVAPKPAPAPAKPKADASAELGCTHFRNIMGDVSAGILTDAELRTKIKEVYDTAYVSENAGVPDGARAMLAAITAEDSTAFLAAATAFDGACRAVGV